MGGGESDSQDGNTALMWAAEYGRAECVRLLIDAGADKEAEDNVRRRSLFCFCASVIFSVPGSVFRLNYFFISLSAFVC